MKSKNQTLEERYRSKRIQDQFKLDKARELEGYFVDNSDDFIYNQERELYYPKDIVEKYVPGTVLLIKHIVGGYNTSNNGYEKFAYNKEIYKEAMKNGRPARILFGYYKNAHLEDYNEIKDIYLNGDVSKEHLIQLEYPIAYRYCYPLFQENSAWKRYENELKSCFKQGKTRSDILIDFGLAMENRDGHFQK